LPWFKRLDMEETNNTRYIWEFSSLSSNEREKRARVNWKGWADRVRKEIVEGKTHHHLK
jgi:hypothetical protein